MNTIVFIYDGNDERKIRRCISSIKKHSDCEIILFSNDPFSFDINYKSLENWHGRRMTRRMEIIRNLPANSGDRIISCDIDVLFQGDPFEVFDHEFDLFYTSREYDCISAVNAGVWGIKKSSASDSLLDFMIKQAIKPSWGPYMAIRNKLDRNIRSNELDWWSNQDLLCALHEYGSPVGRLFDAGPKYNCCPCTGPHLPLTDDKISEFKNKIGDQRYCVIHYKELEGKV